VSKHFPDPDTNEPDGPDFARQWGGRYRFYLLDLGAVPNNYESTDGFTNETPTDSGSYPDGDPPIWEMVNNPVWAPFDKTFTTKVARDVSYGMFFRFSAPYLYRPRPADVYLVANNNWSDYYSRPAPEGGGGVSYTDLTKVYHPDFVSKNLGAALPGAAFVTEAAFPKVKTFRYLGCSTERMGTQSALLGARALVPDPSCQQGDKFQHALEVAKSQGEDVVGAGNNGATVSATVVRAFVEQNREDIAPFRPGLFTVTNISVVFPGAMTWYLPAIVGGVAFGTPDNEAWGVLNNTNDRVKGTSSTDCKKSPGAPGCTPGSPQVAGAGFTYTIEHESSHFLGLLHPHDSVIVDKDANGKWNYYRDMYYSAGDFSQAPTTYAGAFAPYSVLDQDIIQRGHIAEYLRMGQDWIADAYQADGIAGRRGPSPATTTKQQQMERWRALGSRLFGCGDYLHGEYAMRNAYLSSQGVYGPIVEPRLLQPGERVLFAVHPQAVYGPDGPLPGCAAANELARSLDGGGLVGIAGRLPATGGTPVLPLVGLGLVGLAMWIGRRRRLAV
jgi:LPXTG-motif cell wall-anchored protein